MQTNNILCKIRLPLSLLFPWIRGEITIKETSVRLWAQKATLGFIPSGSSQQEIQYDKISTAGWTSWMDTRKIRGAIILFVLAFYCMPNYIRGSYEIAQWVKRIIALWGLEKLLSIPRTALILYCAGNQVTLTVPFTGKKKVIEAERVINEMLLFQRRPEE